MMTAPLIERFWAKVDRRGPDECWLWKASFGTAGYGQIVIGGAAGRPHGAHRVSYEMHKGLIPDGMCVLHRCDVKACVNPGHLFLGTLIDNNADMKAKGRHAHGPRRTHCKNGHKRDGVFPSGERYCKTCRRESRLRTAPLWRARNADRVRSYQRAADAKRRPRKRVGS